MKKQSIITLILAVFISSFAQAKVVYVNKNATGATHNGSSWATAFTTVQSGVNASVSGDEVWVAKSAPAAEAYVENVTMKENVALYGGFVGTETERSQRNWTANVTVIESPSGGSSVVKASVSAVILDGFTISNGASGVLVTGSATVTNCTISRNYNAGVSVASEGAVTVKKCFVSGNGGYGIYVDPGTATVYNSTISNNVRHGIWIRSGTATVKDNIISDNLWHGFSVSSGTAIVMNCAIGGNRSSGVHADSGIATVTNCTVNSNSEDGIFVSASGTAIVTNCTISGNTYGTDVYDGTATISNSIVTFNGTGIRRTSTGYSLTLSYNDVYGNTTANYSNITDPTGTNGNISVDPLLSNPYRDIHIQPGSPCRDAGNDALVQPGWTDIDGQPRIQGAHVDIGSDESDGTTWTVPVATRFVKPTGDDGNDGLSWATAKKTITSALTVSQGLDEIWVSAGTYTENVSIPLGVTLYGGFVGTETERNRRNWATNVTTIASPSTSSDVVTVNSPGVTLDGFTIRNGRNGVYVYYGTATVSNCTISGNSRNGVYMYYAIAAVSNCAVSGNGTGVDVHEGTATVSNCAISGNGTGVFVDSSGTKVTNSIVAFNGTGIHSTGYEFTLSYNDVYGNTTTNYSNIVDPTGTNGNISVDPLFVDRDNKDFHLQAGSPCIDAGDDSVVPPSATDLDGKPRISGAHVDMGAYEFTAGLPPYALLEAVGALKVGAGLLTVPAGDMARMDVDADGGITIIDAARIARKVAGLDANP